MSEKKKKKSGAQFAQIRRRKLLEAAGSAQNQKNVLHCFQKTPDQENNTELTIKGNIRFL